MPKARDTNDQPKSSFPTRWTRAPPPSSASAGSTSTKSPARRPTSWPRSSATMTGWRSARRPRSPPSCSTRATNLKVVGRAGIGVDNVDIPAATARGVVVMNTPFGNSITTAEHAIALMFALARQLPEADASTQAGKWEKNRFMGVEVTGKTLGPDRRGQYRLDRRRARARAQDEGGRVRSLPDARARGRDGGREGRPRHAARAAPTSSRCTRR